MPGTTRVVRVLPDVSALDRAFDYTVPAAWDGDVRVGSIVRVRLHGRRVGGWVVADDVTPPAGVRLQPLAKVTGWGPPPALVDLARWAAWRWAGPLRAVLRSASPPGAVRGLPPAPSTGGPVAGAAPHEALAQEALAGARSVVRLPPAADLLPLVLAAVAAARGDVLVLAPSVEGASALAGRMRGAGVPVALAPRDWARAAAGGWAVVGARGAAWSPVPGLAAAVVIDAHDEAYREERSPTWNAWEVVAERAGRAGVACVLVSPCPTLEQLAWGRLLAPARAAERSGWPVVEIIDRRRADPRSGLYSDRVVDVVRGGGRVACVLNRKGRAQLLACGACGELLRCEHCDGGLAQADDGDALRCRRCERTRAAVCQSCGAARLRRLRPGVTRVREELEALAGRPVAEVTGESADLPGAGVLVGTDALLHRLPAADAVVFLDFDRELLAARFRAAEQALALLARAARLVGGRAAGGRVVVQTRLPGHEVLRAAVHADAGRVAAHEAPRRADLRLPPAAALALVSGDGAGFVAALGPEVEVLGPADGRWLVRASDHTVLADALAAVPRTGARLRVEVDPARV
ncbi:MAG TPA: hypothetical protein VHM89_10275 [Acidimicrobiales bacterium]|nr:hypothetical protein [Acidimicrobiales bacterium]